MTMVAPKTVIVKPQDITKVEVFAEEYKKSYSLFRFGRRVTEDDIRKEIARNGVGKFLTLGLPNEALRKGWDLVEEGGDKPVDYNDEFRVELKKILPDFCRGIGLKRSYGHCLNALVYDKSKNMLHFRAFEPRDYEIKSDSYGNIIKAYAEELVVGYKRKVGTTQTNKVTYLWDTVDELGSIFHSVNSPGRNRNRGESYLLPIWDDINTVNLLGEHTAIFIIRTGAGRIIVTGPADMLSNTTIKESLITTVQDTNSVNGFLFLPQPTIGGGELKVTLEGSPTTYNVLELRSLYIRSISAHSHVPAERLDGSSQNYSESDNAAITYIDVLQEIQDNNNDEIMWLTNAIVTKILKKKAEGYEPRFIVREELTETDKLDIIAKKFETLNAIMYNQANLNISLKDAMAQVGLEYKITEIEAELEEDAFSEGNDEDEKEGDKKNIQQKVKDRKDTRQKDREVKK